MFGWKKKATAEPPKKAPAPAAAPSSGSANDLPGGWPRRGGAPAPQPKAADAPAADAGANPPAGEDAAAALLGMTDEPGSGGENVIDFTDGDGGAGKPPEERCLDQLMTQIAKARRTAAVTAGPQVLARAAALAQRMIHALETAEATAKAAKKGPDAIAAAGNAAMTQAVLAYIKAKDPELQNERRTVDIVSRAREIASAWLIIRSVCPFLHAQAAHPPHANHGAGAVVRKTAPAGSSAPAVAAPAETPAPPTAEAGPAPSIADSAPAEPPAPPTAEAAAPAGSPADAAQPVADSAPAAADAATGAPGNAGDQNASADAGAGLIPVATDASADVGAAPAEPAAKDPNPAPDAGSSESVEIGLVPIGEEAGAKT